MSGRVYVETTIPSYLASHPSRDLLQAARQQITHDWWKRRRHQHELFISRLVLGEAAGGDADAAVRRLTYLSGIPLLDLSADVEELAEAIMRSGLLPPPAARDAIHIAVATVHQIDFLLTWNCRHIANATITKDLRSLVDGLGFELPVLCTPEELMGS